MSNLEAKKIAPATGTTVTLGAAGDAVEVASSATLKTNTIKDAGGNTLFTSDGSGTITSINSGFKPGLTFISSQTASGSASLSFTTGIDSTYKEYVFFLTEINPATNDTNLTFQSSSDGGSNYNINATTTYFAAKHNESNTAASLGYESSYDQADSTNYINLLFGIGNGSDECGVGILKLFNPSSTTYVKQWYCTNQFYHEADYSFNAFVGGYFNTTTALNAVSLKMNSGNFDGTIAMYGTG